MVKVTFKKLTREKWAVTLIDKKSKKAVRVSIKAEAMLATKETPFFKEYREKGVPPTQVPGEVVQPLVEKVMNAEDNEILEISDVFDYTYQESPHSFAGSVCKEYGEMVVEKYGRIKDDKKSMY